MLQTNGASPLPPFFVGQQITQDRVNRYLAEKHPILSNAIGKPDTKSIWYSRDHVAQWLSEIDKAGADGMRVYFGSQGDGEPYPNQLCLLMVLTKASPDASGHTDFSIENAPDFQDRDFKPSTLQEGNRDFNTGSPCPPVCDPGIVIGK